MHQRILTFIILGLVLAASSGLVVNPNVAAQEIATKPGWDPSWPLSEEFISGYEGEIPNDLPAYHLEATLDDVNRTLSGRVSVEFTNFTGIPLAGIPFRLYPNAEYYGDGALAVSQVVVDGGEQEPEFSVADTVMTVSLGRSLPTGKMTSIEIAFETTAPIDSPGSFGIFSHDPEREMWILSDWYPIVAGWQSGFGWRVDPPTRWGDPTFSQTSTYDVQIEVPAGLSVVSTGVADEVRSVDGIDSYAIQTGPVREFAMVVDDGFTVTGAAAEGTLVRLHLDAPAQGDAASALAEASARAVNAFAARYGAYPFTELDIVQTELSSALGVSWSGVIFVDAARLAAALAEPAGLDDLLRFTLVHEIGHQWWGGLIGVNSNDHAFMNESITNYLTIVAFEDMYGEKSGHDVLRQRVVNPYLAMLDESGDGVVNTSIDQTSSMTVFGRLIYGKGALGFLAIRLEIGDGAFFEALASYAGAYAFGLAGPQDLLSAFEGASGRQLGGLWNFWFNLDQTTVADVEALLLSAGAAS